MDSCHPPESVDDERKWFGVETTEQARDPIVAHHHPVVDLLLLDIRLDRSPAAFIHGHTKNGKTALAVGFLEFDKPWNLLPAEIPRCGPKVQKNHVAAEIRKLHDLARRVGQREIG